MLEAAGFRQQVDLHLQSRRGLATQSLLREYVQQVGIDFDELRVQPHRANQVPEGTLPRGRGSVQRRVGRATP